jgi:hypothetical protein
MQGRSSQAQHNLSPAPEQWSRRGRGQQLPEQEEQHYRHHGEEQYEEPQEPLLQRQPEHMPRHMLQQQQQAPQQQRCPRQQLEPADEVLHDEGSQHAPAEELQVASAMHGSPGAAASGPGAYQQPQPQQHSQRSSGAGQAPAGAAAAAGNPAPLPWGSQQLARQATGSGSQGDGSGRPSAGRPGSEQLRAAASQHNLQQGAAPAAGSNGSMGQGAPSRHLQHPSLRDLDSNTRSPQSGSTATLPEDAERQAPTAAQPLGPGRGSAGGAPAGAARGSVQQSEGQAGSCIKPSLAGNSKCSQEPAAPPLSGDTPQPSEQLSMQSTAQRPLAQQQGHLAQNLPSSALAPAPDAARGFSAAGSTRAEHLPLAPTASLPGTAQGSALAGSRREGAQRLRSQCAPSPG